MLGAGLVMVFVGPSPSGVCGNEDVCYCGTQGSVPACSDTCLFVLIWFFLFFFFNLPNPVSGLSPLLNETTGKSCRFLALFGIRKAG